MQDEPTDIELQPQAETAPPTRGRSAFKEIMSWILPFLCAIVVALALRTYVFELISVDGPSMLDTLVTGEVVYINKSAAVFGKLERGDIVLCHFPEKKNNYIKRLVALPGDTVEIRLGTLYVNGVEVAEPYLTPERIRDEDFGPITLGEEDTMILGDNRANSSDSRVLGTLKIKNVLGRGVSVIWPMNQARKLIQGSDH